MTGIGAAYSAAKAWLELRFNALAGWASILGLFVTILTYLRVRSVGAELRERSLERSHHKLFQEVIARLEGKPRLTTSHKTNIESLLSHTEARNTRWLVLLDRSVKRQVSDVRRDVERGVSPDVLIPKIEALRALTLGKSQQGD